MRIDPILHPLFPSFFYQRREPLFVQQLITVEQGRRAEVVRRRAAHAIAAELLEARRPRLTIPGGS